MSPCHFVLVIYVSRCHVCCTTCVTVSHVLHKPLSHRLSVAMSRSTETDLWPNCLTAGLAQLGHGSLCCMYLYSCRLSVFVQPPAYSLRFQTGMNDLAFERWYGRVLDRVSLHWKKQFCRKLWIWTKISISNISYAVLNAFIGLKKTAFHRLARAKVSFPCSGFFLQKFANSRWIKKTFLRLWQLPLLAFSKQASELRD